MKERVRFAVGAASMVLAACCLMGALFTAWLRCAAGAVTQAGNAGGGAGQLTGQ